MTQYAYDRELVPFIAELPTVQDFSTAEKIQELRSMREQMAPPVAPREEVERSDRMIPGHAGDPDLPIRIYSPRTARADGSLRPGVLEIHGGGFILGTIDMMDGFCDAVAADVDAVVVSVGYRLAPESPYPAGLHDCYAALVWFAAHASELRVDADRIAIAGQSAGGGLAAGTALFARDQGGPSIAFQLLEIPELDDRLDTPSMLAYQDTPFWNRPNAIWSWRHYLALASDSEPGSGDPPIYAAPARATDLTGLPPTYLSTMEFDPLRDEGLRYAMRLLEAGISVELHNYAGTFHGSAFVPCEPTRRNHEEVLYLLRRRLEVQ